jgi:hypothetical protein
VSSALVASSSSGASKGGENPKLKKHLSIPDYLSRLVGPRVFLEDKLLTSSGVNITFKSAAKKVEVEDVTTAQWLSANLRIFDILSMSMSSTEVAEYHEYTKQIGDLLQVYTESSVMQFDDEHRRMVKLSDRSWIDISAHLERIFLKVKTNYSPSSSGASSKAKVAKKKSGNPCFGFNSKAGCKIPDSCGYKHVCSARIESGTCRENHPKWEHGKFHPPP